MSDNDDDPTEWFLDIPRTSPQGRKLFVLINPRHVRSNDRAAAPRVFEEEFHATTGDLFWVSRNQPETLNSVDPSVDVRNRLNQSGSLERVLTGPENDIPVPRETFIIASNDVHILLRSEGGNIFFDFYMQNILPDSPYMTYMPVSDITEKDKRNALIVREPCNMDADRKINLELLMLAWRQFYLSISPDLNLADDYIMSIRVAALLSFRDAVKDRLYGELRVMLEDQIRNKTQLLLWKKMIFSLQVTNRRSSIPERMLELDNFARPGMRTYFPFLSSHRFLLDAGDLNQEDSHNDTSDDESNSLPVRTTSSPGPGTLSSVLSISNESLTEELNEASIENYNGDGAAADGDKETDIDEQREN